MTRHGFDRPTWPVALLALALALACAAPHPASADTYLKVPCVTTTSKGSMSGQTNAKSSDNQYATYPETDNKEGTMTECSGEFGDFGKGLGYNEGNYGYIGIGLKVGIEYHLELGPFVRADNLIDCATRTDPSTTRIWDDNLFQDDPPTPVTSTAVVGNSSKDTLYERSLSPATIVNYNVWDEITVDSGTGRGLDVRIYWQHPKLLADPSRLQLDQCYLAVLVKLVCFGAALNSGATVTEGTPNVGLLKITTKSFSNTSIDLNALRVDLEGTGLAAADLAAVKLWKDTDGSGTWTAGDALVGTVSNPAALSNVRFTGAPLIDNVPHGAVYLVTVDIAANACQAVSPKYVGAQVVDQTYLTLAGTVDKVVSNADRATAKVVDTVHPNPLWPIRTGAADAARVKIIRKAAVTAAIVAPVGAQNLSVGDSRTVTVRATNATGVGAATLVLPAWPLGKVNVTGSPEMVTSDNPAAVSLAAGASADFSYTLVATAFGSFQYTAEIGYTDQSNGQSYLAAAPAPGPRFTIADATVPVLQITGMALSNAIISNDQKLTLSVTVKNVGSASALDVGLYHPTTNLLWAFKPYGTATTTQDAGSPAAQTIVPGASYTWTFRFTPQAGTSGTKWFECYALGSNVASKVTRLSNSATIQRAAALAATTFAGTPATAGKNSAFNLTLRVTNSGGAKALAVHPAPPVITGVPGVVPDPLPTLRVAPAPASVAIAGGASYDFIWTYNSNSSVSVGRIQIANGFASGSDENSLLDKTTGAPSSIASYTIDNLIHPLAQGNTSAAVKMLIGYSNDSQYYVVNTASMVYAYTQNGILKWSYNLGTGGVGQTVTGQNLWVSYLNGKNVVFLGTQAGRVYAIQDDGAAAGPYVGWDPVLANCYATLTAGPVYGIVGWGNNLYIAADQKVYRCAVTNKTPDHSWTPGAMQVNSVPALDNTLLYVSCADGAIRSVDSAIFVESTSSGPITANVQPTSPMLWNGKLYATDASGKVAKFFTPASDMGSLEVLATGTTNLTDVWISLDGQYGWFTNKTGGQLYKISLTSPIALIAGWPKTLTATTSLYAPLELDGRVYLGGYNSATTRGRSWVLNATTGAPWSAEWPFDNANANSGFETPVCIDWWNSVFLLGSNDTDVYLFSIP